MKNKMLLFIQGTFLYFFCSIVYYYILSTIHILYTSLVNWKIDSDRVVNLYKFWTPIVYHNRSTIWFASFILSIFAVAIWRAIEE